MPSPDPLKVLVVAAHPDDDVLGCGGTIARHTQAGDEVTVVFMTDGVGARSSRSDAAVRRRGAAEVALGLLGVGSAHFNDLPDNQLDTVPLLAVAQAVENVAAGGFDRVYTHHQGDLNVDHRLVHEAVLTALRPTRGADSPTVLCFETASSTEWRAPHAGSAFLPTWYVVIDDVLELKLAALRAYAEEMRPWPHARSVEALEHLARWRGASVGARAAEAFVLARHVQ